MWFDGWGTIGRTVVVGACAYVALVVLLRVSGKRTLAKLNAFDLVVTVALGSTLGSVLTSRDVPLAQGVTAFILLILLQFVATRLSMRSRRIRDIVTAEPRLLLHRGRLLGHAMRAERIGEADVRAAVRSAGFASLADVEGVVLEADGSLSVIAHREGESALANVQGYPPADARP